MKILKKIVYALGALWGITKSVWVVIVSLMRTFEILIVYISALAFVFTEDFYFLGMALLFMALSYYGDKNKTVDNLTKK
jgi:hypothetical protein